MAENTAEDYGWNSPHGPQSCGYITPRVLKILGHLGARTVLDLGAGNGALCGVLAAKGFQVTGVEVDRQGVKIARATHPGVRFYNLGVEDSPTEMMATEQPFDALVSTEVVEHLFAPHQLPIFASRVLRTGGHLILSTPYHGYLKNLALSILDHWDEHHTPLWHGGHIKFWSRSTLGRLLADNGFLVTAFSGVGRLPYLWKSMILVARKV